MNVRTPRSSAVRRSTSAARWASSFALVVVLAAACGSATVTAPPSPSGSTAEASSGPKATPWPIDVIGGVIALGAADAELWKGGADIAKAADAKDVEGMWGAADGLVKLIDAAMPNVAALEAYPHTAELGASYRAAFEGMHAGATQLRDSITAGDSAGVIAGSQKLAAGVTLYGKVRADVQGYINDALAMKKLLLR